MVVATTFTLIRTDQPDAAAWQRLQAFASAWNRAHAHRLTLTVGAILDVTFDDDTHPEYREFAAALAGLEAAHGVAAHVVRERRYDAADYAAADFVEINGVALDEQPGSQLVLNADEVLVPAPCPRCGVYSVFDQQRTAPFAIDEARLDTLTSGGRPAPPGGWDFIEVQAGLKLVSRRFADTLAALGAQGQALEPVLAGRGGPSPRAWLLSARQAVLVPCPVHTPPVDGEFCPVCGTAHCDVDEEDWVRDDVVRGLDMFARHRNLASILYVSGRVYQGLVDAGVRDVQPGRIFRVCHHGRPGSGG